MNKINELKTLRKNNFNENDSEADSVQVENIQNISNKSKNSDKNNKTKTRIEIDAIDDHRNEVNFMNINSNTNVNALVTEDYNPTIQENLKNKIPQKSKKVENKIFMTENGQQFNDKELFSFHDLIIPGGKNGKLCLVNDPFNKGLRVSEICDHFKFHEPNSVIILIGANTNRIGKLFAGLSRAALNTRAFIIDSGLQTGIEKFCVRKNLTLIGIAPENVIEYPKINSEALSNKMLSNGHTHFILIGNERNKFNWGDEAKFKINFAERLANGRKGFPYKSKVVGIILGNIPRCEEEINSIMEKNWPLILIEDSDLSHVIKCVRNKIDIDEIELTKYSREFINKVTTYPKLIEVEEDSEILASATHLCLTITI